MVAITLELEDLRPLSDSFRDMATIEGHSGFWQPSFIGGSTVDAGRESAPSIAGFARGRALGGAAGSNTSA